MAAHEGGPAPPALLFASGNTEAADVGFRTTAGRLASPRPDESHPGHGSLSYGMPPAGDAALGYGGGDSVFLGELLWVGRSTYTGNEENSFDLGLVSDDATIDTPEELDDLFDLGGIARTAMPAALASALDDVEDERGGSGSGSAAALAYLPASGPDALAALRLLGAAVRRRWPACGRGTGRPPGRRRRGCAGPGARRGWERSRRACGARSTTAASARRAPPPWQACPSSWSRAAWSTPSPAGRSGRPVSAPS